MKRILACVDFSPVTARVLAEARALAALGGGTLVLLHVAPPAREGFSGFEDLEAEAAVRDEAEARLRAEAEALGADLAVETALASGDPVDVILEAAAAREADVIVLGSHGRSVVYDLLAGSVAQGVLRRTDRPLLLVPPAPDGS